jgi:hypothetical protein
MALCAMRHVNKRSNTATPSEKASEVSLHHDFDLNVMKSLKKKIHSAQQDVDIKVIPKTGGFRVFFSTVTGIYELFKEETYRLLGTSVGKNLTIKHHMDKGKNIYSSTVKLMLDAGNCTIYVSH